MTEVESVPKAKLDVLESENHVTNNYENDKEQVEVKNNIAEREQNENLSEKTSLKDEKRNDWADVPPPPKNPWTRHLKNSGEKGKPFKLSLH